MDVGKILRRITGKVFVPVLCFISRYMFLCIYKQFYVSQGIAGHDATCEAAVHALYSAFEEKNIEEVLLIEAGNIFITVNRKVFFYYIVIICPAILCF